MCAWPPCVVYRKRNGWRQASAALDVDQFESQPSVPAHGEENMTGIGEGKSGQGFAINWDRGDGLIAVVEVDPAIGEGSGP